MTSNLKKDDSTYHSMNSIVLRTENSEAILHFDAQFINDVITISISNTAFASLLEDLHEPTLRSINFNLQLEVENPETGQRTSANLPIPPQLLDKSPAELREMEGVIITRIN